MFINKSLLTRIFILPNVWLRRCSCGAEVQCKCSPNNSILTVKAGYSLCGCVCLHLGPRHIHASMECESSPSVISESTAQTMDFYHNRIIICVFSPRRQKLLIMRTICISCLRLRPLILTCSCLSLIQLFPIYFSIVHLYKQFVNLLDNDMHEDDDGNERSQLLLLRQQHKMCKNNWQCSPIEYRPSNAAIEIIMN